MTKLAPLFLLVFVGVSASQTHQAAGAHSVRRLQLAHWGDQQNGRRHMTFAMLQPDNAQKSSMRENLFVLRGGAQILGQADALTFGQKLSSSVFSSLSIMYGVACALAPRRTAAFFYGYDVEDKDNNGEVGRFLMRFIGFMTCGIGLISTFAVAAELKIFGRMPSVKSFEHAIGIGLVPRLLFGVYILVNGIPESLRISRGNVWFSVLETTLFIYTMFLGKFISGPAIVHSEVVFSLLLGPLFFFKPSILFGSDLPPSKHEKLMTRLIASYTIMGGVLVASLQNQKINAIPSVGFAALAWVATLVHITFIRKDLEQCDCSVPAHIAMIAGGVAVAAGGLRSLEV